jgi:CBS domain containing-hemolysin-like protein
MLFGILITLFLVLLNGFFVAAEFAIVKVRASQLEVGTADNKSLQKITKHISKHLEAYLAATQLGITIASLGLGWIGEGVAEKIILSIIHALGFNEHTKLAHQIAMPIAFMFVTFLHVVFGELAPKSIAIRYALPTTIWLALPLRISYLVFIPFIFLFNGFANILLRSIGIQGAGEHSENHSEEELQLLIQESSEGGIIHKSKQQILEKVFNFDDKTVKQVMTPRSVMKSLDISWELPKIMEFIVEEKYSRFPVFSENINNIAGVLYTKELLDVWKDNGRNKNYVFNIKDHIKKDPLYVPSNKRLGDLLQEFQKTRKQIAIVVNEHGETLGMITMEDIIEELLGEIYDEHDDEYDEENEKDLLYQIDENSYSVNALANIIALNKVLPEKLPESENYETLSGLVLDLAGRIPKVGEEFKIGNYVIKVAKLLKKTRIQTVIIAYKKENKEI